MNSNIIHESLLTCHVFVAPGWVHDASLVGVTMADAERRAQCSTAVEDYFPRLTGCEIIALRKIF